MHFYTPTLPLEWALLWFDSGESCWNPRTIRDHVANPTSVDDGAQQFLQIVVVQCRVAVPGSVIKKDSLHHYDGDSGRRFGSYHLKLPVNSPAALCAAVTPIGKGCQALSLGGAPAVQCPSTPIVRYAWSGFNGTWVTGSTYPRLQKDSTATIAWKTAITIQYGLAASLLSVHE